MHCPRLRWLPAARSRGVQTLSSSPALRSHFAAMPSLALRLSGETRGVQKVVAIVIGRNRDGGQLGMEGATKRRENSGRSSRAAALHALLRDLPDRLGWREAGDVRGKVLEVILV